MSLIGVETSLSNTVHGSVGEVAVEPSPEASAPIIDVQQFHFGFRNERGKPVEVLTDVSFHIFPGEVFALVGESGCGKSVTCLALTRLLPEPPAQHLGGAVRVGEEDVFSLAPNRLRALRGSTVAYVFQEPATALNPVIRIGVQMAEAIRLHSDRHAPTAPVVTELLASVGIPEPVRCARAFPHQLSGGMKQRVMIAMALGMKPKVLVADEPTTALDVTIQAQILELLKAIRDRTGMAILLVTHDLGIVSEIADRVAVMYAGQIVEEAPVNLLVHDPWHPYTRALMEAVPRLDTPVARKLPTIPGQVPAPGRYGPGCRFADRCKHVQPECRSALPREIRPTPERRVRCPIRASAPL